MGPGATLGSWDGGGGVTGPRRGGLTTPPAPGGGAPSRERRRSRPSRPSALSDPGGAAERVWIWRPRRPDSRGGRRCAAPVRGRNGRNGRNSRSSARRARGPISAPRRARASPGLGARVPAPHPPPCGGHAAMGGESPWGRCRGCGDTGQNFLASAILFRASGT